MTGAHEVQIPVRGHLPPRVCCAFLCERVEAQPFAPHSVSRGLKSCSVCSTGMVVLRWRDGARRGGGGGIH